MLAVPGRGSSAPPEATPGGSARSGRQAGPLDATASRAQGCEAAEGRGCHRLLPYRSDVKLYTLHKMPPTPYHKMRPAPYPLPLTPAP